MILHKIVYLIHYEFSFFLTKLIYKNKYSFTRNYHYTVVKFFLIKNQSQTNGKILILL